jgi:hypothetical protein
LRAPFSLPSSSSSAAEQPRVTSALPHAGGAQASARAYTSTIERVLIPASAELHPQLAMEALENLALSQNRANRPLDITRLRVTTTGTCANDRVADVATSPILDWSGSVQLFDSKLHRGQEILAGIVPTAQSTWTIFHDGSPASVSGSATGFGKATSPGMTSLPRSPNPTTAQRRRGGTHPAVTRNHHTQ